MTKCTMRRDLNAFFTFMENLTDTVCEAKIIEAENLVYNLNMDFLRTRKADDYIKWAIKCLKNNEVQKAKRHALKASRNTVPFANDTPFNEGDDAYVIRFEHGWMDGRMKIKIIKRWQDANGIWKYLGKVYKEDRKSFEDNYQVQIEHTRDLFG